MKVISKWRIEIGGFQILDYGDLLAAEPVWTVRKNLQVVQLDQSQVPFLRNGGNHVLSTSFKIYLPSWSDHVARGTTFTRLIYLANQGVKPLSILTEISTWQCAAAMITDVTTTMEVDSATQAYSSVAYTITATPPI